MQIREEPACVTRVLSAGPRYTGEYGSRAREEDGTIPRDAILEAVLRFRAPRERSSLFLGTYALGWVRAVFNKRIVQLR